MSVRTKGRIIHFRVALWGPVDEDGIQDPKFLATEYPYWPGPEHREAIFTSLTQKFEERYGKAPNERRIIQYREDDVTDKELAGLLMEQEHDVAEHDADSECPGDTPCVQCPPKVDLDRDQLVTLSEVLGLKTES